jgi:hypothetical protein
MRHILLITIYTVTDHSSETLPIYLYFYLFVSNPGLPELTAVIWAACVLYLCTVQVPCYDVGRSLTSLHQQAWRVRVLAAVSTHLPLRPGEACC